jgi:UDP-N-acetylmuramoyl-tripeptide--D-alanyl-D-alanine ligase
MVSTEDIYELFKNSAGICTDSRKIFQGCLFFALKGENFNGNKFAIEALNKGAICSIIDENEFHVSGKTILVKNTLETLQDLARIHRKELAIPILAITGTNGKTTTKELIAAVLSKKFNICFTQGNLNNHIGVPLTLLNMNKDTEFGVVEMGANHPGEIAALCSIADPNFGLITNIGKAHLEGFGSFEGVKNTKTELYRYLQKKNGTIFYHKNNAILAELSSSFRNKVSYGTSNADFTGELLDSPPFVHVKANFPKGVLYLNTHLIGNFNFENILAAACIGNYFGTDPLLIQEAIKSYQPQNIRSQLIVKGGLKIIMDAYNANPTSMQASINSFISTLPGNQYLILGDMLELGPYSRQEHKNILDILTAHPPHQIFLVGPIFSEVAKGRGYKTFSNVAQLRDYLNSHKLLNGNVLIKGSRGIQLEKILDFI